MRRHSRTRRVLKWVGLVGCVVTVLVFAATWVWSARFFWWAGPDVRRIDTYPGNLRYVSIYDLKESQSFPRADQGLSITHVLPPQRNMRNLARWPTLTSRYHFATGTSGWTVLVPLWFVFLMFAAPTAILWYRDRRPPKGHCQACGYDLTGNVTGVCPECGAPTRGRPLSSLR